MATQSTKNRTESKSSKSGDFQVPAAAGNIGAAVAGAAIAAAANVGRKMFVQGVSARKGSWDESLAEEHRMVLGLFDKLLETADDESKKRKMLLMQIGHALDKHAYAEEHVVYTSLREANFASDAAKLEAEHGEVKTFLHRLGHLDATDPSWIELVAEFRETVAVHAALEEKEIFPQLRAQIDETLDKQITSEVNKAGFMMA